MELNQINETGNELNEYQTRNTQLFRKVSTLKLCSYLKAVFEQSLKPSTH